MEGCDLWFSGPRTDKMRIVSYNNPMYSILSFKVAWRFGQRGLPGRSLLPGIRYFC